MTDFENAAFAVFVVLLSRAILSFNLNFYIPISKVNPRSKRQCRIYTDIFRLTRTWEGLNNEMQLSLKSSISEKMFIL